MTSVARLFLVRDASALASHFRELASTPGLARLVPSHGEIADAGADGLLRKAAAQLEADSSPACALEPGRAAP